MLVDHFDIVHWPWIEGDIEELYDVVVLPGVVQPMALGVVTDEIRRAITIGAPSANGLAGAGRPPAMSEPDH